MAPDSPRLDRARLGWWGLVLAVGLGLLFVLHSYVGTVMLAIFVYYGMRPLDRRIRLVLPKGWAAAVTVLLIALPALILVSAILAIGITELASAGWLDRIGAALLPPVAEGAMEQPMDKLSSILEGGPPASVTDTLLAGARVLASVANGGVQLLLAVTAAFYLLRDDDRLASWFRSTVAGEGSAAHAYVAAVDRDLATIYFGNVALVGIVAVLSLVVYHAYNLLAPAAVSIPVPTALAVLTGLASLVPLIVGKLVYVPLVLYLGAVAGRSAPELLIYPVGLFAVSLLVLDLVPMTFLLPKVAGRETHTGLVLLAYLVGPMLFGWYGLFLGPFLLVVGIQLVRIVLPELLHGEPLTPEATSAEGIGTSPTDGDDD